MRVIRVWMSLRAAWLLVVAAVSVVEPSTALAKTGRGNEAERLGAAFRAFVAQDFETAYKLARKLDRKRLVNDDYALYITAQSAALIGEHTAALEHFRALARAPGSRFRAVAPWRVADCLWSLGRYRDAQRDYSRLLAAADKAGGTADGDLGVARFRIAEAYTRLGRQADAISGMRRFLLAHPAHPLAADADARLRELGGDQAAHLDAGDRLARAQVLTAAHLWHESIAELALISDAEPAGVVRERDYWKAMTLFKMRRRYGDAGDIFLRLYRDMGGRAAMALFHGARALSRADRDSEAITWYQRVVARYPSTVWAKEAQFLSGWLEFNMGSYAAAIPHLEKMLDRYGSSKWATDARWFLAFCHFQLRQYDKALPLLTQLARDSDRLEGGKGRYWRARTLQRLERPDDAINEYRELVGRYPFSWYAHLARARLSEQGVAIGPFGDRPRDPADAPAIDQTVDETLAADPLIRSADELLAAGLDVEAGVELRRGERAFIKRHKRPAALAILMDRYRRASNFNRPWMLGVVYGGTRALDAEPKGRARVWWEHAYPRAYRELIERWRDLGKNPNHYLYSIMRKESGFDPHTLSYADAIGLLQMIPPTTRKVAKQLGIEYTNDLLYDPELNIKTGAWYIGGLLHKFKGQIPFGAGSFNSGPRPVMRWLDERGHLPIDELVELVPYRQTREYMKKVTETYSRYLYLYEGVVYDQPLVVDRDYMKNDLTY